MVQPRRFSSVLIGFGVLAVLGCSLETGEVPTSSTGSESSKTAPPNIGQLRGRNHTIIIHAGADGPRFTVTTPDGRVIAAALTADEMRAAHPGLYDTYKKTFAQYDTYIDASISIQPLSGTLPSEFGR
jgi:hypothetical protein